MLTGPLPYAMLIDLDDTIIDFGRREELLEKVALQFAEVAHPLGHKRLAALIEASFKEFWSDVARHRASRMRPLQEVRREIVAELFERLGASAPGLTREIAHELADRFHEARESGVACFPGAIATIDALRASGVKLAIITNGRSIVQRAKIARFELSHRFDHIQIEEEHGFGKPEERAYHHAMRALDVGPEGCWMIGDNLEWEVAAPQRLGIYSVWHDGHGVGLPPDSGVVPDRIIRRLSELLP